MQRRRAIVWGIALILIGVMALFNALGYTWVNMERLWPVVVIIGGIALAVTGLIRDPRDTDNVWFGVTAALSGSVFLYITVGGGRWSDMSWMWPVFPIAAGLGWLVSWFLDLRQISNLVTGLIALAAGAVGFMYTSGRLGVNLWEMLADYWPVILVLIGVGLIAEFLLQRRDVDRS